MGRHVSDPATVEAFKARDASRASERALLAARPSNPWIELDRYRLEANVEAAPKLAEPIKQRRGRGRPPKNLSA